MLRERCPAKPSHPERSFRFGKRSRWTPNYFRQAAAILATGSAFPLGAFAVPPVAIEQAVALAQKNLRERGLTERIYITGVTLERDSLLSSKTHWSVRWSESISRGERKREIGLEIEMDGSVVVIVRAPGQK